MLIILSAFFIKQSFTVIILLKNNLSFVNSLAPYYVILRPAIISSISPVSMALIPINALRKIAGDNNLLPEGSRLRIIDLINNWFIKYFDQSVSPH
jgi:hypothetical protein